MQGHHGESGDGHYEHGHAIDQQLLNYSLRVNGTWAVAVNFVSPQDHLHKGVFYQDRWRTHSTINTRRRLLRATAQAA